MDFRSDTVTQPTDAMRQAMAQAPVGDDVYGDDPTVNELEQWAAERHGFEAALFTTSGTQANLLGLLAHCERGDEYLCGQQAHNYRYEAGGAAVLGSIQPQPIDNEPDGTLDFAKLKAAIKPDDAHFARTKLLSLENTINGKVLPLSYLAKARELLINMVCNCTLMGLGSTTRRSHWMWMSKRSRNILIRSPCVYPKA